MVCLQVRINRHRFTIYTLEYIVPVITQMFEINTHYTAVCQCVYMKELMAPVFSGAEENYG
jgi:hypothetical protein